MRLTFERPEVVPLLRPHVNADVAAPAAPAGPAELLEQAAARRDWVWVIALTLLGALFRFAFLDHPVIWGDEAITYGRVNGPYSELLVSLREAGFAPLHYELYWAIGRWFTLTPFMMRLVPAIAGTLMVPAMFWLARQLVSRRAALLATLFTACSAYLLAYSRDAKMYSHFWLMCTLSMASMLWWLRTRRVIPWLCWVAASCAMMGLHSLGAIVLAIQILFLLTQRRAHWLQGVLFALGVAIILAGPAGYYLKFNRYAEAVNQNWGASGIYWIEPYNAGRDGSDLALFTTSAFLYSWEWPKNDQYASTIEPAAREALKCAGILLISLLTIGLFPWRSSHDNALARPASAGRASEAPWWRTPLSIALWIALPAYGFYCASIKGFLSPFQILWTWIFQDAPAHPWLAASQARHWSEMLSTLEANLRDGLHLSNIHWPFVILAPAGLIACFVSCADDWRTRWRKAGATAGIVAGVVAACSILYACVRIQAPGSVWMPRYLGVVWPAFAIGAAVLLLRLPKRGLRAAAIALLIGVNLAQFAARVFAHPEPPIDRIAQDVWDARDPRSDVRVFVQGGGGPEPGTAGIDGDTGHYFAAITRGKDIPFSQFRGPMRAVFPINYLDPMPQAARQALATPNVQRVIVWDYLGEVPRHRRWGRQPYPDHDLLPLLGANWSLTDEEIYQNYDHWTWRKLAQVRRRVYVKKALATTLPSDGGH